MRIDQKIQRVRDMAQSRGDWTLSENDRTALAWVLRDYDRRCTDSRSHSLVCALVAELPPEGTIWTVDERAAWLRLAVEVFNVVYGQAEGIVVVVEPSRSDEANQSATGRESIPATPENLPCAFGGLR